MNNKLNDIINSINNKVNDASINPNIDGDKLIINIDEAQQYVRKLLFIRGKLIQIINIAKHNEFNKGEICQAILNLL